MIVLLKTVLLSRVLYDNLILPDPICSSGQIVSNFLIAFWIGLTLIVPCYVLSQVCVNQIFEKQVQNTVSDENLDI